MMHKNISQTIRKLFKNYNPGQRFIKKTEKILLEKAERSFEKKTRFSFNISRFVPVSALTIFLFFFAFQTLKTPQQKDISLNDLIQKTQAAYAESEKKEGIFYQKVLFESPFQKPRIYEFYDDGKGSLLHVTKDYSTEKVLDITLTKKNLTHITIFKYLDLIKFQTFLQSQDSKTFEKRSDDREAEFLSKFYLAFPFLIKESIKDKEMTTTLSHVMNIIITPVNFKMTDQYFTFDLIEANQEKPLLSIQFDYKSGEVKTFDPLQKKELSSEDLKKFKTTLKDLIDQKMKDRNLYTSLNLSDLVGENYHCVTTLYRDKKNYSQIFMSIFKRNPAQIMGPVAYGSYHDNNGTPAELLHDKLEDMSRLKLSSEEIQKILEQLRNKKNIQHYSIQENGSLYYVVEILGEEEWESPKQRYYFDAKTFFIKKTQQWVAPQKIINVSPASEKKQHHGEFIFTTTYLDIQYLDPKKYSEIFHPEKHGLHVEEKTSWTPALGMLDGCYDPEDRKLSEEEKNELFKRISKEYLEKFENMKKENIESLKKM